MKLNGILDKQIPKQIKEQFNLDVVELMEGTESFIFGGAIRDIIAEKPQDINDIDIITFSESEKELRKRLTNLGFIETEIKFNVIEGENDLSHTTLNELYKDMHIIYLPLNFRKNNCKVQLIRPFNSTDEYLCNPEYKGSTKEIMATHINNLLIKFVSNVDLTCCGVAWSPKKGLVECLDGAIADCLNLNYKVLNDGLMHQPNRIQQRKDKLNSKGWKEYKNFMEVFENIDNEL